jgi:hypothetical protein
MDKKIKSLIQRIDKNLKTRQIKLLKKLNITNGGNLGDNYEQGGTSANKTDEQESEEDKKKKQELENLEDAAEKKVEDLLGKKLKKDIEKAQRIEKLFMAVDSIIDDPSSAEEQMNILLGASMNIDPQKIKEGAAAVYAVLETIDTDEIMNEAKEIASTASEAMKAMPLGEGEGTGPAAEIMSIGKDLVNDPNLQNAVGDVKNTIGDLKNDITNDPNVQNAVGEVKNAMSDLKNTVNDAKESLGDVKNVVGEVKNVVGDAKAIGAELLKNIPPEQAQAAVDIASNAASAVAKLAENADSIANTLSSVASALEPIMEIGASIPGLGVCLLLVNKLMKQYRESKELKELLEDIQDSVQSSMLLIKLIKTTMSIYKLDSASYYSAKTKLLAGKIIKAKKEKNKKNLEQALKLLYKEAGYLSKIELKPNIEAKVTSKVQNIIETMKRLLPEAAPITADPKRGFLGRSIDFVKRQASKVKAFYNRFGMATFYKAQIMKNLNIVNNLLIIYNSQFEWAQSSFIMRIKDKDIKDKKLLDLIWTRVENSQEFKDYLWHDDGPQGQQGGRRKRTWKKARRAIINKRRTIRKK